MIERRKIFQIPKTILGLGILFLFIPVINYLGIVYNLNNNFISLRSIPFDWYLTFNSKKIDRIL